MTAKYRFIKDEISPENAEHRVVSLMQRLGFGDSANVGSEVMHKLQNTIRLVDAFERAGLKLTTVCEIERWAFFNLARDAKRFAKELTTNHKGFRARVARRTGEQWSVAIRNRSDLQAETLGAMSIIICLMALSHNGWSEGCEATIERDAAINFAAIKGEPMSAEDLDGLSIKYRPDFKMPTANGQARSD